MRSSSSVTLPIYSVLRASTGVAGQGGSSLPPLEPAYSQGLAELAIRFIDRPHPTILIPTIIRIIFGVFSALKACPPAITRISWPPRSLRKTLWTSSKRRLAPPGCRGSDRIRESYGVFFFFFALSFFTGEPSGCSLIQLLGREITTASMTFGSFLRPCLR